MPPAKDTYDPFQSEPVYSPLKDKNNHISSLIQQDSNNMEGTQVRQPLPKRVSSLDGNHEYLLDTYNISTLDNETKHKSKRSMGSALNFLRPRESTHRSKHGFGSSNSIDSLDEQSDGIPISRTLTINTNLIAATTNQKKKPLLPKVATSFLRQSSFRPRSKHSHSKSISLERDYLPSPTSATSNNNSFTLLPSVNASIERLDDGYINSFLEVDDSNSYSNTHSKDSSYSKSPLANPVEDTVVEPEVVTDKESVDISTTENAIEGAPELLNNDKLDTLENRQENVPSPVQHQYRETNTIETENRHNVLDGYNYPSYEIYNTKEDEINKIKELEKTHEALVEESYSPELHRTKIYQWNNINWFGVLFLGTMPIITLVGSFYVTLNTKTLILAAVYYLFSGLGITAGYHRYWSHRAFDASLPLQIFLMLGASAASEGSIKWWVRNHRAHHRFTDTQFDPYAAQHGFWHSHILWLMFHPHEEDRGKVSIDDVRQDAIADFQHRHYTPIMITCAFIVPTLIAGIGWGDYLGGYFYAGIARLLFVHHATFCVNSLAHWLGEASFDDKYSPRDHFITALVTLGEGYHNFHHEFPSDYRNVIEVYKYDPTKWFILACYYLGLVSNLRTFPMNEVTKGKVHLQEKKIAKIKSVLDYGKPLQELPHLTFKEFKRLVQEEKKKLLIIEGYIYNVEGFSEVHPGGAVYIKSGIGRDVTASFNGGIYNHHNAARNLLDRMRVGVLAKEEEIPSEHVAIEE